MFLPKLELARIYQVRPDSRLLYLYYPYRIADLLKRWSPSVARLIRREPASAEIADARAYLSAWLSKS